MSIANRVIRPGTKIELMREQQAREREKKGGENKEDSENLTSQVCDIRKDGGIEIYMPVRGTRPAYLHDDEEYTMYCYTIKGVYECSIMVGRVFERGGIYYAVLYMLGDLKKNQRREFYRYKCTIPMKDRLMSEKELAYLKERNRLLVDKTVAMDNSTIVDISGGGLQFIARHAYAKDDYVYCQFTFGKDYEICFKVLSCTEGDPHEFRQRGMFVGMDKGSREEIIQKIFMMERMLRKRESGV